MKRVRTTPAAVALAAVLAFAAGCGNSGDYGSPTVSGSESSTDGSAAHNAADVTFAQTMIPHHRQAMTMAEVAQTQAANPGVKELAAKIEAEQGREIQTMTKWLEAWGAPTAPAGGMDHGSMPGMDHGSMPGMMTDADMGKMMAAKGVQLDRMFLTMMIEHHIGAVDMAKTEQAKGQNPEAKALAKTIETAQTAEIAQMRRLLEKLG